ncbi:tRNA pseudouridine(55) synthase TruB [Nodosilinea sp. LEGE 07088]|uniref:tRNA pseudouridine(55) synthase TruB n=1 Tax=Nodosilinea sp. LEGE 07088 TaxID=2777968 RepID=UPI00188186EA|nr:tRNA pseudouridine(55) synthase TruB [Nodosilinea sp. LEGE 07088]MBE9137637.1 tRNA pseudouridine(55) synthase TruB [Nodosilinea sp. LEGE 07088]
MLGFLNFHKPQGISSHDCVGAVRRLLEVKKVGHGGTLDPLAEGVLPIAVGRATRLLPYLPEGKAYRAVIRFGIATTTDDLEGEVLAQQPADHLTVESVTAALSAFEGTIEQVPPAFSAIQVQGQRLYDLARKGKVVTPPARTVTIHTLVVHHWQPGDRPELTLDISCGPGTYIRSIARDLGDRVGTGATLAHLTRTRSGGFELADSLSLETVTARAEQGSLALVDPAAALSHLPAIALSADLACRWQQGQKFPPPEAIAPATPYRVIAANQERFLGIGQLEERDGEPILKAKMVFYHGSTEA